MSTQLHTGSYQVPTMAADAAALLTLEAAPANGNMEGSSIDKGCEGGCAECATGEKCGSGAVWSLLNALTKQG